MKNNELYVEFEEKVNKKTLKKALEILKVKNIENVIKEIHLRIRYYSRILWLETNKENLIVWYSHKISDSEEEDVTILNGVIDND